MATLRLIKSKIKSVKSTQQITKAMNLVAASKLQRNKANLQITHPYHNVTKNVVGSILANSKNIRHKYTEKREVKNTGIIVLSGDRGLCGGYNVNVCKEASKIIDGQGNEKIIVIGTKGRDYFRRRRKSVVRTYSGISERPFYSDAVEIGNLVMEMYDNKEIDEIYLVYTQFTSALTQTPIAERIMPIDETKLSGGQQVAMNYEPDEQSVLDYLIPKYITTCIYGAMVESATSEQGARMTSMDSATKNASKMIDTYSSQYNRARQGAITQEITEIVSGANALS